MVCDHINSLLFSLCFKCVYLFIYLTDKYLRGTFRTFNEVGGALREGNCIGLRNIRCGNALPGKYLFAHSYYYLLFRYSGR